MTDDMENNNDTLRVLTVSSPAKKQKADPKDSHSNQTAFRLIAAVWVVVFALAGAVFYIYFDFSELLNKDEDKKEKLVSDINNRLESISQELNKKDKKLSEVIETNKKLSTTNQSLQKENQSLSLENKSIYKKNMAKETQIRDISKQMEGLKQEKDQLEAKNQKLFSDNKLLTTKMAILKKGIESGNQKEGLQKESLLKIVQKQKMELSALKEKLKQFENSPSLKDIGSNRQNNFQVSEDIPLKDQVEKYKKEVTLLKEKLVRSEKDFSRQKADVHYNLGYVFDFQGDYKRAVQEYKKAAQLNPKDKSTHYNLAIIYDDHLKDYEQAIYHYQKYLELAPYADDRERVKAWILDAEKKKNK